MNLVHWMDRDLLHDITDKYALYECNSNTLMKSYDELLVFTVNYRN